MLDDHRGHGMMDANHGRRVVRGRRGHGSLRRRCVLDDHRGHGMMDANHGRHVGHDHRGHGMTDVNHDRHRVGRGRHGHGVVRRHQTCCHHDVDRHCDRRHHRRRAVDDALRGLAFRGVRVRLVRPQ